MSVKETSFSVIPENVDRESSQRVKPLYYRNIAESSDSFKVNEGYEDKPATSVLPSPARNPESPPDPQYWHPDEGGLSSSSGSNMSGRNKSIGLIVALIIIAIIAIVAIILAAIGFSKKQTTTDVVNPTCGSCNPVGVYYLTGYDPSFDSADIAKNATIKPTVQDNVYNIVSDAIKDETKAGTYYVYTKSKEGVKITKFLDAKGPFNGEIPGSLYYATITLEGMVNKLPNTAQFKEKLGIKSSFSSFAAFRSAFLGSDPINFATPKAGIIDVEPDAAAQCDSLKVPPIGTLTTVKPTTVTGVGPTGGHTGSSVSIPPHSDMTECDPSKVSGDLVFLVDMVCPETDTSLCNRNLASIQTFLKHFSAKMPVGPINIRLSVVPYADRALDSPNPFESRADFDAYVDKMGQFVKDSQTHHAMFKAIETVINGLKYPRPTKYETLATSVVIIPSGLSFPPNVLEPTPYATELENMGVTKAGISPTGSNAVFYQLKDLVSPDHYYQANYTYVTQTRDYQQMASDLDAIKVVYDAACTLQFQVTTKATTTTNTGTTPTLGSTTTGSTMGSTTPTGTPPPAGCEKLDIVFVVDSSDSVGLSNFHLVLDFVANVTKSFTIGERYAEFALVIYNDRAWIRINLGEYNDRAQLDKVIKDTLYYTGNTNTWGALDLVRRNVFGGTGDRAGYPNVVILITDGVHTAQYLDPTLAANDLRSEDEAVIICMGVQGANGVPLYDYSELLSIAGGVVDNVFTKVKFTELNNFVDRIIERFPCKTACPADIAFVVETSEIMAEPLVTEVLTNYTLSIADNIGYGEGNDKSHVALAHFSSPDGFYVGSTTLRPYSVSYIQFGFDVGQTYFDVHNQTYNLSEHYDVIYGVSDLRLGVQQAVDMFEQPRWHHRQSVPRIVVFIATGFVSQGVNCCPNPFGTVSGDNTDWVNKLRGMTNGGNNTFGLVIDVPSRTNRSNMVGIVGSEGRVFDQAHYLNISWSIRQLLDDMDCYVPPPELTPCHQYMDVVFVLHLLGNGTIEKRETLRAMANFLGYLSTGFGIDNGYTNLAVVTYATIANAEFDLNAYHSGRIIRSLLDNWPDQHPLDTSQNPEGIGGLAQALSVIRTDVFHNPGDRPDQYAPNTVIIITDHLRYDTTVGGEWDGIMREAKALKDLDVLIEVLTVGNDTNMINRGQAMLLAQDMYIHTTDPNYPAGTPPGQNWTRHDFNIYNYTLLADKNQYQKTAMQIQEAACNNQYTLTMVCEPSRTPTASPPPTIPTTPPPTECHYMDLLFIIDESQSLTDGDFENVKVFLNNFADALGATYISQTYIRTAMIGFAYDPFIEFYFNDITSITEYKTKINSLIRRNGLTYTAKAFDTARDYVLKINKGFRPDSVPSAIIFITDGNYDGADPAVPAHEIRDEYGTTILSVAVEGEDSIDMNKLIEISGTKDDVFKINNYANLTTIVNDLIKKSCKQVCPGDVVFLVETSEQITQSGVNATADRIFSVATSLDPPVGGNNRKNTHLALTRFSNPDSQRTFTYDFDWGSSMTNVTYTLRNLVNEWDAIKGLSDLGYGLYRVSKLFTDAGYGRRRNIPSVLVIFAQGYQDPDDRIPHYPPPWNDPSRWPNPEAQAENLRKLGVKIYAVAVPPNAGAVTTPSTKMIGNQFTLMRNVLVNLTGGHTDQVVGFDEYNMIPQKINALLAGTKDCIVKPPSGNNILDIVFVIDSSRSVGFEETKTSERGFNYIKTFVADEIARFQSFSDYGTRVGVVSYARTTETVMTLGQYTNRLDIIDKVKSATWLGKNDDDTNYVKDPDAGLRVAQQMFNDPKKDRSYAPNVVIFVIDGIETTAAPDPRTTAASLRSVNKATILGMGNSNPRKVPTQNCNLLKNVTGASSTLDCSTNSNPFQINGWVNLYKEVGPVYNELPPNMASTSTSTTPHTTQSHTTGTGTTPTTQTTPTSGTTLAPGTCRKYDVAVLMDVSGTLKNNMEQQKQFVNDVFDPSHGIKIDQTSGTRVGIVTVSSSATLLKGLAGYQNYDALKADVNGVKNFGLVGYNLAEALGDQGATAANGMFGTSEDRPDAPDITVVFVGEQPMDMGAAVTAAKTLQDPPTNAKIIMVYAPGVDKNTFKGIHSDAEFQLANWETNTISAMATQVAAKLCDIANENVVNGVNFAVQSLPAPQTAVTSMDACPKGYSGVACDKPVCHAKGTILPFHKKTTSTIDTHVHSVCYGVKKFPVDSHTSKIHIKLDSLDNAQPEITLIGPDGKTVENLNILTQTTALLSLSLETVTPGYYSAQFSASKPCTLTISGDSNLDVSLGFVMGKDAVHNDVPSEQLNSHTWGYLVAHTLGMDYPGSIQTMELYQDGQLWLTRNAVTRYNCAYETIFGRMTCDPATNYLYKIYGIDEKGYGWERSDSFTCKMMITCKNGGTPAGNTCWCKKYFEGADCSTWMCINGGKFETSKCSCPVPYNGAHCEEVQCTPKKTIPQRKGNKLVVAIQGLDSMKPSLPMIADGIQQMITSLGNTYFSQFVIVGFSDRESQVSVGPDASNAPDKIRNLQTDSFTSCNQQRLYVGLDMADNMEIYQEESVVVFLNSLPTTKDDAGYISWQNGNAFFKTKYYIVLLPPKSGCPAHDRTSVGYEMMEKVATMSGGLVIELGTNDDIKDFLVSEAQYFFLGQHGASLMMKNHDKCGPMQHQYFFDSTTTETVLLATGKNLQASVLLPSGGTLMPSATYTKGNFYRFTLQTLTPAPNRYTLQLSGDQTDPCSLRLMAKTDKLQLFFSFSPELATDSKSEAPLFGSAMHLVAHLTDADTTQNAELKIFSFDDSSIAVHTSSGRYRAQCGFDWYFGPWTCDSLFNEYYIKITFFDVNGYQAQRSTTTFCSDILPTQFPPTTCQHGGVMSSSNKCVCTDYWTGQYCTDIVCANGGQNITDSLCQCVPGWTGTHCENNICIEENANPRYGKEQFLDRSLALVIQYSPDMEHDVMYIKENIDKFITNLNAQNSMWITKYTLVLFDDTDVQLVTSTSSSATFISDVKELNTTTTTTNKCQKELLGGIDVALTFASHHGYVFVFGNSPGKDNQTEDSTIFNYLREKKAEVYFYMSTPFTDTCHPYDDKNMQNIAEFSKGEVYYAAKDLIREFMLEFIPTFYRSGLVYEYMPDKCETEQTFTFSMDSQSTAYTVSAGTNDKYVELSLIPPVECECGSTSSPTRTTMTITPVQRCQKLDILFVIDASQSVGKDNFEIMKTFMVDLTKQYSINANDAQFAAVCFNRKGVVDWYFNTFDNLNDLDAAIKSLVWLDGISNTADAFEKAKTIMNGHGARADAPDAIVFLSDGVHTQGFPDPIPIAKSIRNDYKARIISVALPGTNGAEADANYKELIGISGDINFVVNVTEWYMLPQKVSDVIDIMPCPGIEPCTGDITFIMETSELMAQVWVNRTRDAIIAIAKELNVDVNRNHISLVHFSSPDDRSSVLMNDKNYFFNSIVDFENALNAMVYTDVVGITDIDLGLSLASKVLSSNESRGNSPNIAILFARGDYDHSDRCCPDPSENARKLREMAALFGVVVPVPNWYSIAEMVALTAESSRVYNWTTNANRLISDINGVINTCQRSTTTVSTSTMSTMSTVTPTALIPVECQKQDILFILDASQSVGTVNFKTMKDFVIKISQQFQFGNEYAHFAVIDFNRKAYIRFYFKTFNSLTDVDSAINALPWMDGITNIADALEQAKTIYTTANGMRTDAQNTIVLVTDGVHTEGFPDPAAPAKDLRTNYGTRIISVGVAGVNGELEKSYYEELVRISGDPGLVVNVTEWNKLTTKGFDDTIKLMSCKHQDCYGDVSFIMETSEIMDWYGVNLTRKAILDVADKMTIGPDADRISLVHFSSPDSRTGVLTKLSETTNYFDFKNKLDKMLYRDVVGITDLYEGLKTAADQVYIPSETRTKSPNIAILFARGQYDHSSTCCKDPWPQAKRLRYNESVTLYSVMVDVNPETDAAELRYLSSTDQIYSLTGKGGYRPYTDVYDAMRKEINTCAATTTTGTTPTASTSTPTPPPTSIVPNNCQKLDILFIIDSTQSVGSDNFKQIQDFIMRLTHQFRVNQNNGGQFAVINFARSAVIDFYLNTFESRTDLDNAISGLHWLDGITNTDDALQKAKEVLTASKGMRTDAPNRIILFSDGVHTTGFNDPVPTAAELRSQYNSRIICLGVDGTNGKETVASYEELVKISGTARYVINVTSWDHVNQHLNDVINLLCPECIGDITFIIETSERVGMQGVEEIKQSVINVANELAIGQDESRVALVHFSSPDTRSAVKFYLKDTTSNLDFDNGVKSIEWQQVAGISDLELGLQLANDKVVGLNGARPNIPEIVVLYARGVWDHAAHCCNDPMAEADKLRSKSLIYAVRAPSAEYSVDNLEKIAGSPAQYFDDVNDYMKIATQIKTVIDSCRATTPTSSSPSSTSTTPSVTITPIIPNECQDLDLIFILDASQSVGPTHFNTMKDFIKKITLQFTLPLGGKEGGQFAAISFNRAAVINFYLNTFDTVTAADGAIAQLPWLDGITNTESAMTKALELLTPEHGIRPDSKKTIVFISDGVHTEGFPSPAAAAAVLRDNYGVRIISVGIAGVNGDETIANYKELLSISGDQNLIVNVTDWTDLNTKETFEAVIEKLPCSMHTTVPPKPCVGDIGFVIETSELMSPTWFNKTLDAVVNLAARFSDISAAGTHVALTHFSGPPGDGTSRVSYYLRQTSTFEDFKKSVLGLKWTQVAGISDIDYGLRLANDYMLKADQVRSGVPSVIVLFARGNWDHSDRCCPSPFPAADDLRKKATIYAVEVPIEPSRANLATIAGSDNRVYTFNNSDYLKIADEVAGNIQDGCRPTSNPCINAHYIVSGQSLIIQEVVNKDSGIGTCQSVDRCYAGNWQAKVKTGSAGQCWIQVRAQSPLQLFNGFSTFTASDMPRYSPSMVSSGATCTAPMNYGLAHATSLDPKYGKLEYMNIYMRDNANTPPYLSRSARYTPRESCAYEYRTEGFTCPSSSFGIQHIGTDKCGYSFTRMDTAMCLDFACKNGGFEHKVDGNTCGCFCPNNYMDRDCAIPVCYNGGVVMEKYTNGGMLSRECACAAYFGGNHCLDILCTQPTPVTYMNNGTLVLIMDISTGMEKQLTELQTTADTMLGNIEKDGKYRQFAFVSYGNTATKTEPGDAKTIAAAIKALKIETVSGCERNTMSAIMNGLEMIQLGANIVSDNSRIYVITNHKYTDTDAGTENWNNFLISLSNTGASINFVVPEYSTCLTAQAPSLFSDIVMASRGNYLPIALPTLTDPNPLTKFLTDYSEKEINSQIVASSSDQTCQSYDLYISVDKYTTSFIVDIRGTTDENNVHLYKPDDSEFTQTATWLSHDLYVTEATIDASSYGIWRLQVTTTDKTSCSVQVKAKTDMRSYLGFTTSIHSDTPARKAAYPAKNIAVVYVSNLNMESTIEYAKLYTTSHVFIGAEQIKMRSGCNYQFVSDQFECPAKVFLVEISGRDHLDYPMVRWGVVLCPSYNIATTSTQNTKTTTTMAQTTSSTASTTTVTTTTGSTTSTTTGPTTSTTTGSTTSTTTGPTTSTTTGPTTSTTTGPTTSTTTGATTSTTTGSTSSTTTGPTTSTTTGSTTTTTTGPTTSTTTGPTTTTGSTTTTIVGPTTTTTTRPTTSTTTGPTTSTTTGPTTTTTTGRPANCLKQPPVESPCDPCYRELDIVILVDTSSHMIDIESVRTFLGDTLFSQFNIDGNSAQGAHVGVAYCDVFSGSIVNMKTVTSTQIFIDQLAGLKKHPAGILFLSTGLDFVRTSMITSGSGDRPNVPNVVIVIASKNSEDDATKAAQDLKDAGATIITIGVGTNAPDLSKIASNPQFSIIQKDFTKLNSENVPILKILCAING